MPGVHCVMSGPINRVESATEGEAPRTRAFVDADGNHWLAHEQPFAEYDRRSGMSLIFSNDAAVRRVRDYPSNWFDLTDEELAALSWRA